MNKTNKPEEKTEKNIHPKETKSMDFQTPTPFSLDSTVERSQVTLLF
jgi:hypothetical protein